MQPMPRPRASFELDQGADPRAGRQEAGFLEAVGPRAYQYALAENLRDPFLAFEVVKDRLERAGEHTPNGRNVASLLGEFMECGAGIDEPLA